MGTGIGVGCFSHIEGGQLVVQRLPECLYDLCAPVKAHTWQHPQVL